jgi:hypothetical protein
MHPIMVIDRSEIRAGKLQDLEEAVGALAAFVETNEPRPISYDVYFDVDRTTMTVVQVHPDLASMELHMNLAGPAFPKFAELLTLRTMDVYGEPSDVLLDSLRRKIEMLGSGVVTVHVHRAGFNRMRP